VIVVRNVSAGYGKRTVLRDISLTIQRGEMVGLLGPNGSGKTTLLLTISGVLQPESGSVTVADQELHRLRPRRRARLLASVAQRAEPPAALTVRALVLMGRYPYLSLLGGYSARDHAAADRAMEQTGAAPLADRYATELSGGELQRVNIARALAQEADAMLLDEAGSGLDIGRKVDVYDLLRSRHQAGVTILSAIHDLNLAALYCQRLVFLKHGQVVADGPTPDVFNEQTLSRIYETRVSVFPHPVTGAPQGHLVPGAAAGGPAREPRG
jgi:iron complex transport system ATP-binding protein